MSNSSWPTSILFSCACVGLLLPCLGATQDIEALREQIDEVQTQLESELLVRDGTLAELAKTEQLISQVQKRLASNEVAIRQSTDELAQLDANVVGLNTRLNETMSMLSTVLVRGYSVKPYAGLQVLLGSTELSRLGRIMAYHKVFANAHWQLMNQIRDDLAEISRTQSEIQKTIEREEMLLAERTVELSALNDLRQSRAEILTELAVRIEDKEVQLAQLQADEARLAKILATATIPQVNIPDDATFARVVEKQGQLAMPVAGVPVKRYGQLREGSAQWRGWLIETAKQAPVRAIGTGRVIYANWLRGYGLLTIIDHQDDILSLYGHNDALFFEVGDWVREGEQIGLAGQPTTAGYTNLSGIYFEMRQGSEPVDPADWLAPETASKAN